MLYCSSWKFCNAIWVKISTALLRCSERWWMQDIWVERAEKGFISISDQVFALSKCWQFLLTNVDQEKAFLLCFRDFLAGGLHVRNKSRDSSSDTLTDRNINSSRRGKRIRNIPGYEKWV